MYIPVPEVLKRTKNITPPPTAILSPYAVPHFSSKSVYRKRTKKKKKIEKY